MKNIFASFLVIILPIIGKAQEYKQSGTLAEQAEDFKIFKTTLLECHAGIYDYNDSLSLFTNLGKLEKAITSKPLTQLEQLALYTKFISTIKCIHTVVYHQKMKINSLEAKYSLPFKVYFLNDKLTASETYFSDQVAIHTNDQIIKLNGQLVQEIKDSLYQFISSDGNNRTRKDQVLKRNFLYFYFLYNQSENDILIQYIHENDTITNLFKLNYPTNSRIKNGVDKKKLRYSIDTSNNVAIITLPEPLSVSKKYKKQLSLIMQSLDTLKIENLIVDIRNNGGGKEQSYFAGFFVDTTIEYGNKNYFPLHNATYKKYFIGKMNLQFIMSKLMGRYSSSSVSTEFDKPKPQFKGQLYVLINGNTASAASNLASVLKEWSNAIIVGEESGGGYKSYNTGGGTLQLPNSKIRIGIRTIKGLNNVKNHYDLDGITPHFEVKTTLYFNELDDEQMEFIFDLIHFK